MIKPFYLTKPPQEEHPASTRRSAGFAWRNAIIISLLGIFSIAQAAYAQNQTVSGKVTSSLNEPMPGVSVLVKGTTIGTSTDADGNFTVSVPAANSTLVFSFIGFTTREVPVGNSTRFDIVLEEDVTQLNEVVVTALGISQQKKSLGYATQEVKGAEISKAQRPNFFVALQGRVAGLTMTTTSGNPGASASITLRGINSIGGNNQPLIVVDGLPIDNRTFSQHAMVSDLDNRGNDFTNRASDINPNDIESITVLKGPEGAALYGQDGANGAIIITTKKGTQGQTKVDYDNNFSFQKVYRHQEVQKEYGRGTEGRFDATSLGYFGPRYAEGTTFYNNRDKFFETGFSQTHNLGIEGGNEKVTYRLSNNLLDQKGTIPTSHYQKISSRLSSTLKISPKLDIGTSITYTFSNVVKPIKGQFGVLTGVLSYPITDDATNYLNPDGSRRKLVANTLELDNPFYNVNKNHSEDKTNRVLGNVNLNYNATPWLSLVGRFGGDIYSTLGNYYIRHDSYTAFRGEGGGSQAGTNGFIDNYAENSRLLNGNLLATAKKTFGKFNTSLMFGGSFDDRRYEVHSTYGAQFQLYDYNSMNITLPATRNNKTTTEVKRLLALLGTASISYNDIAYLTVSARNDWSSTMPVENRSYFYPSVQASFVFSELEALQNIPYLSFGKLRASFAEVGKDAPAYKVKSSFVSRTTTGGGFAYGFFGGNPYLKPERARGYEVGTELKFFGNRLGLDVAVYRNDRENQIVSQRLSYATGFIFGLINGGDFSNRGFEIQLSGSPVQQTDFKWDVLFNFAKNKTKVQSLPAGVAEYYDSDTWVYGNARASSFPSNLQDYYSNMNLEYNQRGMGSATAIGGYSYLRNNNGDILIDPSSGLPITNTTFLPIGDRNPDFNIGLTNTFTYKNFSLSFLLDIRKGGDVFNGNELFLFRNGLSTLGVDRETPVIIKGVLRDGQENSESPTPNSIQITPNTRGQVYYNSIPESEFVEHDINWLRLRDVTLSYQLPAETLSKTKVLRTASVYVTGNDLFLLTNYTGADPNVNATSPATGGAGAGGIDFGALAVPRSISFGVRVGF